MNNNVGPAVRQPGVSAGPAADYCVTLGRMLYLSGSHSPYL